MTFLSSIKSIIEFVCRSIEPSKVYYKAFFKSGNESSKERVYFWKMACLVFLDLQVYSFNTFFSTRFIFFTRIYSAWKTRVVTVMCRFLKWEIYRNPYDVLTTFTAVNQPNIAGIQHVLEQTSKTKKLRFLNGYNYPPDSVDSAFVKLYSVFNWPLVG